MKIKPRDQSGNFNDCLVGRMGRGMSKDLIMFMMATECDETMIDGHMEHILVT